MSPEPTRYAIYFWDTTLARFLRQYPELRLEISLRGGQIDPIAERVDVAFQTAKPIADP